MIKDVIIHDEPIDDLQSPWLSVLEAVYEPRDGALMGLTDYFRIADNPEISHG
jgi:hypothetical protein